MYAFNNRAAGIFADGFKDRDGLAVGDTFGYRLRAKLVGRAGRAYSLEQTAALVARYSSAEMDAMMSDDPRAPHIRVEYDRNFFGGARTQVGDIAYVPVALIDLKGGDVPAAFELMYQVDRAHVMRFDCDEFFDAEGQVLDHQAEAPAA